MHQLSFRPIAIGLLLSLFPVIALSMPTVSDSMITWPDNGWYQVQRADTYETVCEGTDASASSSSGGACLVDDGSYVVVNHTTGERFENITVSGASQPETSPASVSVDGQTIRWPDNGWYQVQSATTFESVCEGGQSCDVPPGTYVVINHTTGERVEDIRVGSATESSEPSPAGVTVQGNELSWPDDGWYQVQSASDYSTVCEGGRGCTVSPGSYVVINHSTGERFNDINVGENTDSVASNPPASVVVEGNIIRLPDDGWYQVQNANSFDSVCEGGRECQVQPGAYFVINHTSGERSLLNVDGEIVEESSQPDGMQTEVQQSLTRVEFSIVVPAYQSDALSVRLDVGDTEIFAAWVTGETWFGSAAFAQNSMFPLQITFADRNGGIVLGTVDTAFATSAGESESVDVTADQFVTYLSDDDSDGVSNLDELLAGTDPLVDQSTSLPIRESVRIADFFHTFRGEPLIPATRPYSEREETIPDGTTIPFTLSSRIIDINESGNGSFSTRVQTETGNDNFGRSFTGTRTNTGGSILWTGTYSEWERAAGQNREEETSIETSAIDTTTRQQTGELAIVSCCSATRFEANIAYTMTGRMIGPSQECEPIAGTYFTESRQLTSNAPTGSWTLTKSTEGTYWRAVLRRGGIIEDEFLAERFDATFFCDYPELR